MKTAFPDCNCFILDFFAVVLTRDAVPLSSKEPKLLFHGTEFDRQQLREQQRSLNCQVSRVLRHHSS